jgi:hypothetical protein
VDGVETAALRHDKFDHNRERVGTMWLVADERHVQLEHVKQLDEIYNEEEWQAICAKSRRCTPISAAPNCARTPASTRLN